VILTGSSQRTEEQKNRRTEEQKNKSWPQTL
jgi:hypothetical protein